MPKKTLPLTDVEIRNAKPRDKAYKLADGGGLYLEVLPSGGKSWRMKYRFAGQEKRLVFGLWPDVSLKQARERREEARAQVAGGIDPGQARKVERVEAALASETFELVAKEWYEKHSIKWADRHGKTVWHRLQMDAIPWLGPRPIREIKAPELLSVLQRIEGRGACDLARRVHQYCSQVFRFAVATGRAERDVAADLRGALTPRKVKHFASIKDPRGVARLLRGIEEYEGSFVVRCALRFAPLVFVRPGELRHAEWGEIALEGSEWRIPAHKTKMREQHIVPLSRQAVVILKELHPLTGGGRYVFPSERTQARPMSENTINAALRYMGYSKEEMTGHGFRSMASTLLNEQGWPPDVIERQLAHAERNSVRASYNFAEYLPDRRKMMQSWADYLEALKTGAKVIPIHQEQAAGA